MGMDRSVRRFWSVVASMNDRERAALLRFVTSCERPPPLGFESMQPPFCLHRVGIRSDGERLPTASTCFNTLKLPTYSSEKVTPTSSLFFFRDFQSPSLQICLVNVKQVAFLRKGILSLMASVVIFEAR